MVSWPKLYSSLKYVFFISRYVKEKKNCCCALNRNYLLFACRVRSIASEVFILIAQNFVHFNQHNVCFVFITMLHYGNHASESLSSISLFSSNLISFSLSYNQSASAPPNKLLTSLDRHQSFIFLCLLMWHQQSTLPFLSCFVNTFAQSLRRVYIRTQNPLIWTTILYAWWNSSSIHSILSRRLKLR